MNVNGISRIRRLVIALSSAVTLGAVGGCTTTGDQQAQEMTDELETEGLEAKSETIEAGNSTVKKMKKKRKKSGKKMHKKMKKRMKKNLNNVKKDAKDAMGATEEESMDSEEM